MVSQHYNYGFSVPVVFRGKAQCAGNGHSLVKHCNAVAGHHGDALWVSLSTPTDCVACKDAGKGREPGSGSFAPLDKDRAIACETRLAVNVDKLTELAIIMLGDH